MTATPRQRAAITGVVLLGVLAALALGYWRQGTATDAPVVADAGAALGGGGDGGAAEDDGAGRGAGDLPWTAEPVWVHVTGAVHAPGLYRVPAGSRVDDVVKLAGGPLDEANLEALNLAERVRDGQKVRVPLRRTVPAAGAVPGCSSGTGAQTGDCRTETETAAATAADSTLGADSGLDGDTAQVNVNTATVGELERVPHIGPVMARRIVAAREDQGGFSDWPDLLKVKGIGPKTLSRIRTHLTLD